MYCENCGAEIKEGSKFCPNCGAPVKSMEQINQIENSQCDQPEKMPAAEAPAYQTIPSGNVEQPKKKNNTVKIVGIAAVAVIAFVVGIMAAIHFTGPADSDSDSSRVAAVEAETSKEDSITGYYYEVYDDGSICDTAFSQVVIIDNDTIEIQGGSIVNGVKQEPTGTVEFKKVSNNKYEHTEPSYLGQYKSELTFKDGSFELNVIDPFERDHITKYVKQ